MNVLINRTRSLPVADRWCVHSYYTLCPYAPDDSGRLLLAGVDLKTNQGEVIMMSAQGEVLDTFGEHTVNTGFFHTGFWQTWSPDASYVYYQSGTLAEPQITRRELATKSEITVPGDMEGAPPFGEPIVSGLMGMLYAAGYGDGKYTPETAPMPFQQREDHGLFGFSFSPPSQRLLLSVAEVLDRHPDRDRLLREDRLIKSRLGTKDGLTLMTYCVRWSPSGDRLLFYFGNHCVVQEREEPRLAYVFTATRDLQEIHLALDLSFGRRGVHWGWHPDGEHLIGYGPDPQAPGQICLAQVRYDGSDYRKISSHCSGGHPSISPADYNLLVTDTGGQPGSVDFIDRRKDTIVKSYHLPRVYGEREPFGRNPYRVCHHPVFSGDGRKVLVNTLPHRHGVLQEIEVGEALR